MLVIVIFLTGVAFMLMGGTIQDMESCFAGPDICMKKMGSTINDAMRAIGLGS